MKQVGELIRPGMLAKAPMGSDQLTKEQREAVGYFFVRLKAIDPTQYDTLMPDLKTETLLKREYAPYLKDYTKQQIDRGLEMLHRKRQEGDPDYRWLNIDSVIRLIEGKVCGEQAPAGIYRYFEPLGLPDKAAEEKARKAGASELQKLKGMF